MVLTHVEQLLLEWIAEAGSVESLFRLAVGELGVDYSNAHRCLSNLESLGLIEVIRRGRGRPLIMRTGVIGNQNPKPATDTRQTTGAAHAG
jgi:predicted transcriptional regulator